LVDRESTGWCVSVLQVAGSADSADDILAVEAMQIIAALSRCRSIDRAQKI